MVLSLFTLLGSLVQILTDICCLNILVRRGDAFGINPIEGESEPEEIDENLMSNPTSTFFPGGQTVATSFQHGAAAAGQHNSRRAPVMGNRGLESQRIQQERSRSKSKGSKEPKSKGSPRTGRKSSQDSQVVALDERNLKRAVNR